METQAEKVYVAIGTDLYDGFSTLQWTLKKWLNKEISIVILHAANGICRDYVYTPLGKLPACSVSEEKLKFLEKTEEAKCDKILSQYIAFCGRVKAEVRKIEKNDQQPMYKQMVELISTLQITKLVMSFTFMKSSSSWKSRSAISGSFYVHRRKPDFCELFVIYGGRLVYLKEQNDEGLMEDDRGFMIAKLKERNRSIKNWLGKMFPENNDSNNSPSSSKSNYDSLHQWEKYGQEIEKYVNHLLSLHEEEGEMNMRNAALKENSIEIDMKENMHAAERIQVLKLRIQDAQDAIQSNKNKANAAKERREKAEWAINMCNARAEELEACVDEEVMKNAELKKDIDYRKEDLNELQVEVEEKRSKLNSVLELQKELSGKLKLSVSTKTRVEFQLEKAVRTRADMVQEIEEFRKQRDVLQRRIEFCKEKDAIEKVSKLNGLSFDFREFSAEEIRTATKDFSERLRLQSCDGKWTNVYRARLYHITVAVKMYSQENAESREDFAYKVKRLSQVQHPNLLAMIGFCSELNCIIYEYTHHGDLSDALFSTERNCKRKNRPLNWHTRIHIASNICSALGFLHKARPKPIIHGNLNPKKVLLDRNNVAKLNGFTNLWSDDMRVDIKAFGNIVLQLLTGKNDRELDFASVVGGLDHLAGQWPMELAMELCDIAIRCLSDEKGLKEESFVAMPVREINDVRRKADQLVSNGEFSMPFGEDVNVEDLSNVPSAFLCPIFQDIMQNPHLAADGFSYELEAIDEWLKIGHDTSPMTNLKLKHKLLTPNHTLRSLILDWQNKKTKAPCLSSLQ